MFGAQQGGFGQTLGNFGQGINSLFNMFNRPKINFSNPALNTSPMTGISSLPVSVPTGPAFRLGSVSPSTFTPSTGLNTSFNPATAIGPIFGT